MIWTLQTFFAKPLHQWKTFSPFHFSSKKGEKITRGETLKIKQDQHQQFADFKSLVNYSKLTLMRREIDIWMNLSQCLNNNRREFFILMFKGFAVLYMILILYFFLQLNPKQQVLLINEDICLYWILLSYVEHYIVYHVSILLRWSDWCSEYHWES